MIHPSYAWLPLNRPLFWFKCLQYILLSMKGGRASLRKEDGLYILECRIPPQCLSLKICFTVPICEWSWGLDPWPPSNLNPWPQQWGCWHGRNGRFCTLNHIDSYVHSTHPDTIKLLTPSQMLWMWIHPQPMQAPIDSSENHRQALSWSWSSRITSATCVLPLIKCCLRN